MFSKLIGGLKLIEAGMTGLENMYQVSKVCQWLKIKFRNLTLLVQKVFTRNTKEEIVRSRYAARFFCIIKDSNRGRIKYKSTTNWYILNSWIINSFYFANAKCM